MKQCRRLLGLGIMVIIFLVAGAMVKQCIPFAFQEEYDFNSGITMQEQTMVSTLPIFFPDIMRHKGEFVIENDTEYSIYVATPEGFSLVDQGEYTLSAEPLAFWLMKPEMGENRLYDGSFVIRENEIVSLIYHVSGDENKVYSASYEWKLFGR